MNSKEYWAKREAENLAKYQKKEATYDKEIERIYENMLDGVQKEINGFYVRYADKEGITLAEAKKRVSQLDIAAYEKKAKRYVEDAARDRNANNGKTNTSGYYFSDKANEEMRLYNLTMKVNRLEMLKANIGLELINGHNELENFMGEILQGRTMDELERQAGILGKTIQNNAKTAHAIVNASFHNATFSDRIWMYQDMMKNELSSLLQSGLIQGKNPNTLARHLEKRFGVSRANAERLMRTELARVQTEAQKQSFEENGFEEYTFHAIGTACPVCLAISGKHFKIKKMVIAENAPPMHPNCRCSISAYEDSEEYEAWLDYLSNGGSTEDWNKSGKAAWKRSTKRQTGGKESTGGKSYSPYNPNDKRDVQASKAYRTISKRNDVAVIANNSGFTEEEIVQIKRHIFYNKHKTYQGYKTLYPDYDMAVAWNRIFKGESLDRDIILLKHELLESRLEKEYNLTISEAHKQAREKYDWEKRLYEDLGEDGEPDGLL